MIVTAYILMPVALTIDIGTSSVRASLWDEQGKRLGDLVQCATSQVASLDGAAQFDADELVASVEGAIDEVLARAGLAACRVVAVGTSGFWHSLVGVDESGLPVTTVSTWADTRARVTAGRMRAANDEGAYHRRTGAMLHSSYPISRIPWLKERIHESSRPATMWMSFPDYFRLRLFGVATTGASMASGSGLFDPNANNWDAESLELAGITASQLPELSEAPLSSLDDAHARRWPSVARVPWFPVTGDGACATIGSGCVGPDRLALTLGTSGAVRIVLESKQVEIPGGLFAYRIDLRRWVVGGALSEGGGVVKWLCSMFGVDVDASLETRLREVQPDSHGLTILPFAYGERSPGWNDESRFTIAGMTAGTHPVAIVRAALESIAFRFQLIADRLGEVAPAAADIVGSGGALQASPLWCQILADVTGRRLVVPECEEGSSRGAALLALEATGDVSALGDVPALESRIFEPDPAAREVYRAAASRQQRLYDAINS